MHKPAYPGKQPIQPAKRVAVVACMDARFDVEDLLGLQTGDAYVIRNAGGVVNDDVHEVAEQLAPLEKGFRHGRGKRRPALILRKRPAAINPSIGIATA